MKLLYGFTLFFGFLLNADPSSSVLLQVLLKGHIPSAMIEAKGGSYEIIDPLKGTRLTKHSYSRRALAHPMEEGIQWSEGFPGIFQIKIAPTDPHTILSVDGRDYLGAIELFCIEGHLHIVNEIELEDFVKSQMAETYSSKGLHSTTLEAIAILKRTDAFWKWMKHRDRFFQLKAEEEQYQGYEQTRCTASIENAVLATEEEVLSYQGHPFPTAVTENAAGPTISYSSLFRSKIATPPGIKTVEIKRSPTQWTRTYDKRFFASLFDLSTIEEANLFLDPFSQRVYGMRLREQQSLRDVSYRDLRPYVNSSFFEISMTEDLITFSGYGQGDGVGLCLYTAERLAKEELTTYDILAIFYPDCLLKKVRKWEPSSKEMSTLLAKR